MIDHIGNIHYIMAQRSGAPNKTALRAPWASPEQMYVLYLPDPMQNIIKELSEKGQELKTLSTARQWNVTDQQTTSWCFTAPVSTPQLCSNYTLYSPHMAQHNFSRSLL